MKKKVLIIGILIIVIGIVCFNFFRLRTDVFLGNFSILQNGNKIILDVGVSSSAGYISDIKVFGKEDEKYIKFYSTFGINSKKGAKDSFEINVNNDTEEIYFYDGIFKYKKVLDKNDIGEWINVSSYDYVNSLKRNKYYSISSLVKFDGILYGESYDIIDYNNGIKEKIGVINKLVDEDYVPKLDNETNDDDMLYAEVYDKKDDSIVLYYDNEYVLFKKIS